MWDGSLWRIVEPIRLSAEQAVRDFVHGAITKIRGEMKEMGDAMTAMVSATR